jgi:lysophospholipase L1-like esterase
MKKILTAAFALFFLSVTAMAQQPAFYNDIQRFKQKDSVKFPPAKAILFVGSSSFTRWTDVQNYFPEFTIINRGFGGSSLPDVIRYAADIILPYDPKQVVIYCGENDFTAAGGVDPAVVAGRVMKLIALIRCRYPSIPIAYVSMKPSPARAKNDERMRIANKMIEQMTKENGYAAFINVYDAMLGENGKVRTDIFVSDSLHMNSTGYGIWQKVITPFLTK